MGKMFLIIFLIIWAVIFAGFCLYFASQPNSQIYFNFYTLFTLGFICIGVAGSVIILVIGCFGLWYIVSQLVAFISCGGNLFI